MRNYIYTAANLFALGGVKWRNLRTRLTPAFSSGKLRGMFQTLTDCGVRLERTLKEHNTKECIDIKHILGKYLVDLELTTTIHRYIIAS